jgi:hypothetical protein
MGRDLDCMADVLMGFHRSTFSKTNTEFNSDLVPCDFWSGLSRLWKGRSEARNFEVINGLQHVFEKWVERCKKCITCQRRYFGKDRHRTSTKFRLGVIRWVHELFKRPSYNKGPVKFWTPLITANHQSRSWLYWNTLNRIPRSRVYGNLPHGQKDVATCLWRKCS